MTPLSKELEQLIEKEAEIYADDVRRNQYKIANESFKKGANSYAGYKEKFEQAKKALEDQAADLRKKIKAFTDLLPQVEQRMLTAKKEEDWYEEKECKVLITVWGTNVKQWTETLTGIETLFASWKEEEGAV